MRRRTYLLAAILIAIACQGCKTSLTKLNSDAITLLTASLQSADAAHQRGFLAEPSYREVLTTGESTRKILVEINAFAKSLPEKPPSDDQKLRLLTAINSAIAGMDSLVAAGSMFQNPEAQAGYYRFARPAQAAIVALSQAIEKIKSR